MKFLQFEVYSFDSDSQSKKRIISLMINWIYVENFDFCHVKTEKTHLVSALIIFISTSKVTRQMPSTLVQKF